VNIVLIGYRCTGKSSVGKILAGKLQVPFYDTDEMIEIRSGSTISEIVRKEGWESFRRMERETIRGLENVDRSVIVPGGGAVMDEACRKSLGGKGLFFWLTAEPSAVLKRMQADGKSRFRRPALPGCDTENELTQMKKRMPVYRALSDFHIDTTHRTVRQAADRICDIIENTGIFGKG